MYCILIFATFAFLFQNEVAEHVVSYQPGAKASSDFATFPVSSFVKVIYTHTHRKTITRVFTTNSQFSMYFSPCKRVKWQVTEAVSVEISFSLNCSPCCLSRQAKEEKQGGTVYVGRVAIPCTRGQEQVHRLVLSQQQLQKVHRLLMAWNGTPLVHVDD